MISMKTLLVILLTGVAHPACERSENWTSAEQLKVEFRCDGKLVMQEETTALSSTLARPGLCENKILKKKIIERSCGPEDSGPCQDEAEEEATSFSFSSECDELNLRRMFFIGESVDIMDLEGFIESYRSAKDLAKSPQGLGWQGAHAVFARSKINDIYRINRRDGAWELDARICENDDQFVRECTHFSVTFKDNPTVLEDVKSYWMD